MSRLAPYVYLDHAATTPLKPAAREAMLAALQAFGNPSSVHAEGQKARALLDEARRGVGEVLGVRAERVVLTSGGTEAANLGVAGIMSALPGRRVVYSAVEHDSVIGAVQKFANAVVPVDGNGVLRLDALEEMLKAGEVGLVCLMHANNETGVLQPVAEAAALAHRHGALLLCDAVQTVGHLDVKPDDLGVDALVMSAHKFGGPKGVGALVLKPELHFVPQVLGGAQERGRRAGTENVAGACAMAAALAEKDGAGVVHARLFDGLKCISGVAIVAPDAARVSHVVQVRVPGKSGEDLVMAMDLAGVAVSQGSACSSGRAKPSHVLKAMGLSEAEAGEGLRLSLGWNSTEADVDAALAALQKVVGR